MMLWCGLKSATGFIVSGASWEGLWCNLRSAAVFAQPGSPDKGYKIICIRFPSMLSLEVPERR